MFPPQGIVIETDATNIRSSLAVISVQQIYSLLEEKNTTVFINIIL